MKQFFFNSINFLVILIFVSLVQARLEDGFELNKENGIEFRHRKLIEGNSRDTIGYALNSQCIIQFEDSVTDVEAAAQQLRI
jgi:hypothetical protein